MAQLLDPGGRSTDPLLVPERAILSAAAPDCAVTVNALTTFEFRFAYCFESCRFRPATEPVLPVTRFCYHPKITVRVPVL